jgi:hypothetical protein
MVQILSSILMVVTTLVPLVYTGVKAMPIVLRFVKLVFSGSRGIVAAGGLSGLLGFLTGVLSIAGILGFFASIYFGWGFELYLKFFDFVFTPFAYVAQNLIASFINQLPNLPANTASALCLFDFGSVFTMLVLGFSFEAYLRIIIFFLVRRR